MKDHEHLKARAKRLVGQVRQSLGLGRSACTAGHEATAALLSVMWLGMPRCVPAGAECLCTVTNRGSLCKLPGLLLRLPVGTGG